MTSIEQDSAIVPVEDVVAREVGGEAVLLDMTSGIYFGLNAVGTLAWQRIETGKASFAQICDAIEAEFDAPREVIEKDARALVEQLLDKGLVKAL